MLSRVGPAALSQPLTQSAVITLTGSYVDIPNVPSWAKRIMLLLNDASFAGSADLALQLGTASGIVTTNYKSGFGTFGGTTNSDSTWFRIGYGLAGAYQVSGIITLANAGNNAWMQVGQTTKWSSGGGSQSAGKIDLGGVLTQMRLLPVAADTFDGGSVTCIYEG